RRWDWRGASGKRRGRGTSPRPCGTGLVPREHLGGPIDGPRFVAFPLSLKDREDRLGRLARGRVRRVDLENERKASDRFLQAHVDRLRFDVLPDFFRRPTAGLESGTPDG